MADDFTYPYLLFTDNEGTQTTVGVTELEITFSDGQLMAKNGDGTISFPLATLTSMTFSETSTTTKVETPRIDTTTSAVEVFTVAGIHVGSFDSEQQAKAALKRGLYVIKSKEKTYKLNIR